MRASLRMEEIDLTKPLQVVADSSEAKPEDNQGLSLQQADWQQRLAHLELRVEAIELQLAAQSQEASTKESMPLMAEAPANPQLVRGRSRSRSQPSGLGLGGGRDDWQLELAKLLSENLGQAAPSEIGGPVERVSSAVGLSELNSSTDSAPALDVQAVKEGSDVSLISCDAPGKSEASAGRTGGSEGDDGNSVQGTSPLIRTKSVRRQSSGSQTCAEGGGTTESLPSRETVPRWLPVPPIQSPGLKRKAEALTLEQPTDTKQKAPNNQPACRRAKCSTTARLARCMPLACAMKEYQ